MNQFASYSIGGFISEAYLAVELVLTDLGAYFFSLIKRPYRFLTII